MSDFEERARDLPVIAFAYPGPLRDQLTAAVLAGAKTSTTSLLSEYDEPGEVLPLVGQRYRVIDSADRTIAICETTEVRVVRLGDVDLQQALDEGEGFTSVQEWRAVHEKFWTTPQGGATIGVASTLTDDDQVVCERFRLIEVRPD